MECWKVKRRLSAYLDDAVSDTERRDLRSHLKECQACAAESEQYQLVRATVRALPKPLAPPDLAIRLRVIKSRELARLGAAASPFDRWFERMRLSARNMMRPIALPIAGGLCSTIFLFSSLVPTFDFHKTPGDVAILSTAPLLKNMAPLGFMDNTNAVVDLKLDDTGRVVDYTIVRAEGQTADQVRRSIENTLLFTTFTPATRFGLPTSGTFRISFSSSRIEVMSKT
jgi:hypothetical protein